MGRCESSPTFSIGSRTMLLRNRIGNCSADSPSIGATRPLLSSCSAMVQWSWASAGEHLGVLPMPMMYSRRRSLPSLATPAESADRCLAGSTEWRFAPRGAPFAVVDRPLLSPNALMHLMRWHRSSGKSFAGCSMRNSTGCQLVVESLWCSAICKGSLATKQPSSCNARFELCSGNSPKGVPSCASD